MLRIVMLGFLVTTANATGGVIQSAIDGANNGDVITISPGTYVENIHIEGKWVVLRSSDGPEQTIIDGSGDLGNPVVTLDGFVGDSTIEGFTITGGALGIRVAGSTCPKIRDCVVTGNDGSPGGISIAATAAAKLIGCVIADNHGRGVDVLTWSPDMVIRDCTFVGNTTNEVRDGGALWLNPSRATVINCVFDANVATRHGGAIAIIGNPSQPLIRPVFINCRITGNHASVAGGGVYVSAARPEFVNCAIVDNSADVIGGGTFNGGFSASQIRNCIVRNNFPYEVVDSTSSLTRVHYSNIEGGWDFPGSSNVLDLDPLFVDPSNGDYRPQANSPCIDAGVNNALPADLLDLDNDGDTSERIPLDLDGNPRFADDPATLDSGCGLPVVVDMGAYEFQGNPFHPVLIGDVDGNGTVDVADLLAVLATWGTATGCELSDLDFDGAVEVGDLLSLLANWS